MVLMKGWRGLGCMESICSLRACAALVKMFHCKFFKNFRYLATFAAWLVSLPRSRSSHKTQTSEQDLHPRALCPVALHYLQKEGWKIQWELRFVQNKTRSLFSPSFWFLLAWVVCSGNGLLAKWVFEVWLFQDASISFGFLSRRDSSELLSAWRRAAVLLFSDPPALGRSL